MELTFAPSPVLGRRFRPVHECVFQIKLVDLLLLGVLAEIRKVAHDLIIVGKDIVAQSGVTVVLWHLRETFGRDTDDSRDEELVFDTLPMEFYGKFAHVTLALLRLSGRDFDAFHPLEGRDSVIDYVRG